MEEFTFNNQINMSPVEVDLFVNYIHLISGINIDKSKIYFFQTRLQELLEECKASSFLELYAHARSNSSIEKKVIDAVTTNETYFFRDPKYFDLIKYKLIPDLIKDATNLPLKIWSCACSTGQEAYSLSMVLDSLFGNLANKKFHIIGTDISESVVNRANKGEFTPMELNRGLHENQIERYFTQINGNCYKIKDELRSICQFKTGNILVPQSFGPIFDIILCRNVLIYFNDNDKRNLLASIAKSLKRNGYLIIGAAESLLNLSERFTRLEYKGATYYTLK